MGVEDDDDCQGSCPMGQCHYSPLAIEMQAKRDVWRVFRSHETHPECCRHRKVSMAELTRLGLVDPATIRRTRAQQHAPIVHEKRALALRKFNPVKMARARGHVPEYVISTPDEPDANVKTTRLRTQKFRHTVRQRFPYSLAEVGFDDHDVMPWQALIVAPPLPAVGISLHDNGLHAYIDPATDTTAAFITAWYAKTFPAPGMTLYHLDTDTTIPLPPNIEGISILAELTNARERATDGCNQ
ncbi:hypothetical protein ACFYV7_15055 [Nocardia suismassiliense]|uniref:Uncharacterized protein n=1 Tax=Nocardia suismassiliense TaxID=2077092 RepID=A0ABW6QSI9_9NOCA